MLTISRNQQRREKAVNKLPLYCGSREVLATNATIYYIYNNGFILAETVPHPQSNKYFECHGRDWHYN